MAPHGAKHSARLVRALPGTYELIVRNASSYVSPGATALDLGAGSGALAEQLMAAGFRVTAADVRNYFELDTEFVQVDCNDPNFDQALAREFDVITSVEVIEHLENPTAFLRSIRRLLKPKGVALLTTPNVENVPARLKFLRKGLVRTMDMHSSEHITPIHLDLFRRMIVPRTGLVLVDHFVHPKNDFPLTGRRYLVPFLKMLVPLLSGPAISGDCHFFVLKKAAATSSVTAAPSNLT
jgi:SAM-dependent methyltransferase